MLLKNIIQAFHIAFTKSINLFDYKIIIIIVIIRLYIIINNSILILYTFDFLGNKNINVKIIRDVQGMMITSVK